eukprot:jgi/Chlat1/7845/Chrsp66S07288
MVDLRLVLVYIVLLLLAGRLLARLLGQAASFAARKFLGLQLRIGSIQFGSLKNVTLALRKGPIAHIRASEVSYNGALLALIRKGPVRLPVTVRRLHVLLRPKDARQDAAVLSPNTARQSRLTSGWARTKWHLIGRIARLLEVKFTELNVDATQVAGVQLVIHKLSFSASAHKHEAGDMLGIKVAVHKLAVHTDQTDSAHEANLGGADGLHLKELQLDGKFQRGVCRTGEHGVLCNFVSVNCQEVRVDMSEGLLSWYERRKQKRLAHPRITQPRQGDAHNPKADLFAKAPDQVDLWLGKVIVRFSMRNAAGVTAVSVSNITAALEPNTSETSTSTGVWDHADASAQTAVAASYSQLEVSLGPTVIPTVHSEGVHVKAQLPTFTALLLQALAFPSELHANLHVGIQPVHIDLAPSVCEWVREVMPLVKSSFSQRKRRLPIDSKLHNNGSLAWTCTVTCPRVGISAPVLALTELTATMPVVTVVCKRTPTATKLRVVLKTTQLSIGHSLDDTLLELSLVTIACNSPHAAATVAPVASPPLSLPSSPVDSTPEVSIEIAGPRITLTPAQLLSLLQALSTAKLLVNDLSKAQSRRENGSDDTTSAYSTPVPAVSPQEAGNGPVTPRKRTNRHFKLLLSSTKVVYLTTGLLKLGQDELQDTAEDNTYAARFVLGLAALHVESMPHAEQTVASLHAQRFRITYAESTLGGAQIGPKVQVVQVATLDLKHEKRNLESEGCNTLRIFCFGANLEWDPDVHLAAHQLWTLSSVARTHTEKQQEAYPPDIPLSYQRPRTVVEMALQALSVKARMLVHGRVAATLSAAANALTCDDMRGGASRLQHVTAELDGHTWLQVDELLAVRLPLYRSMTVQLPVANQESPADGTQTSSSDQPSNLKPVDHHSDSSSLNSQKKTAGFTRRRPPRLSLDSNAVRYSPPKPPTSNNSKPRTAPMHAPLRRNPGREATLAPRPGDHGWYVEGKGVRIAQPHNVQVYSLIMSAVEVRRLLKIGQAAQQRLAGLTQPQPLRAPEQILPKPAKYMKLGSIKVHFFNVQVEVQDDPFEAWLQRHQRLMREVVGEGVVREKFISQASTNFTHISDTQLDNAEQRASQSAAAEAAIADACSAAYIAECKSQQSADGCNAPPHQTMPPLLSLSSREVELLFRSCDGGSVEAVQKLNAIDKLSSEVSFSEIYGGTIAAFSTNLEVHLRSAMKPLVKSSSWSVTGDVLIAQQAVERGIPRQHFTQLGRDRQVGIMKSTAAAGSPHLKLYTNVNSDWHWVSWSLGVGLEPAFVDVVAAIKRLSSRQGGKTAGWPRRVPAMGEGSTMGQQTGAEQPALQAIGSAPSRGLQWWDSMRYFWHGKAAFIVQSWALALQASPNVQRDTDELRMSATMLQCVMHSAEEVVTRFKELLVLQHLAPEHSLGLPTMPDLQLLKAPSAELKITPVWQCLDDRDPQRHFLHPPPGCQDEAWLSKSQGDLFDIFRSHVLHLIMRLRMEPEATQASASATSPYGTPGVQQGPVMCLGPEQLVWLRALGHLLRAPPHHIRRSWVRRRFGAARPRKRLPSEPRLPSLPSMLNSIQLDFDFHSSRLMHVACEPDDPAAGLSFAASHANYTFTLSRQQAVPPPMPRVGSWGGLVTPKSASPDGPATSHSFSDVRSPKMPSPLGKQQTAVVIQAVPGRKVPSLVLSAIGVSATGLQSLLASHEEEFEQQVAIERKERRRLHRKLATLLEAGNAPTPNPDIAQKLGYFFFSTSSFSLTKSHEQSGSQSASATPTQAAAGNGSHEQYAPGCLFMSIHGLKLLWTLEARDAIWAWTDSIFTAWNRTLKPPHLTITPPATSTPNTATMAGLLAEATASLQRTPVSAHNLVTSTSTETSDLYTLLLGARTPVASTPKLTDSASASPFLQTARHTRTESSESLTLPNLSEQDSIGEVRLVIDVFQPQFNLQHNAAEGRVLLVASSGRFVVKHCPPLVVANEEVALPVSTLAPEQQMRERTVHVLQLQQAQAHMAQADVDPAAGMQWVSWVVTSEDADDDHLSPRGSSGVLKRVFTPCTMKFQYTRYHENEGADATDPTPRRVDCLKELCFQAATLSAEMDPQQFSTLLGVVNELLLASLPRWQWQGGEGQQGVDALLWTQTCGGDTPEVAWARNDLMQRRWALANTLQDLQLLNSVQGFGFVPSSAPVSLEEPVVGVLWWVKSASVELLSQQLLADAAVEQRAFIASQGVMRAALKRADAERSGMNKQQGSIRFACQLGLVSWSLISDGSCGVEASLRDAAFTLLRGEKESGVLRFIVHHFALTNMMKDASNSALLGPWDPNRDWTREVMLRIYTKQEEKTTGTPVISHFEVGIFPLRVHMTEAVGAFVHNYFAPRTEVETSKRKDLMPSAASGKYRWGRTRQRSQTDVTVSLETSPVLSDQQTTPQRPLHYRQSSNPEAARRSLHYRQASVPEQFRTSSVASRDPSPEVVMPASKSSQGPDGSQPSTQAKKPHSKHQRHSSWSGGSALKREDEPTQSLRQPAITFEDIPSFSAAQDRPTHSRQASSSDSRKTDRAADDDARLNSQLFSYVRFNELQVSVSYEGRPMSFNDLWLRVSPQVYANYTGSWWGLYNMCRKHILWCVLKSLAGMQGKRSKDAPMERSVLTQPRDGSPGRLGSVMRGPGRFERTDSSESSFSGRQQTPVKSPTLTSTASGQSVETDGQPTTMLSPSSSRHATDSSSVEVVNRRSDGLQLKKRHTGLKGYLKKKGKQLFAKRS